MSELLLADISKSISEWNSQALDGKIFEIESNSVSKALSVVKGMGIYAKTDIFVYLCALNLLNAAIKTPEFKGKLSYSIIKPNAGRLIRDIDNLKDASITYYYDQEEGCLYIKVEDVIFSFHQVPPTPEILKASFSKPIQWSGVRLQKIAQPLFYKTTSQLEMSFENDLELLEQNGLMETLQDMNNNELFSIISDCYEEQPSLPGWYRNLDQLYDAVNLKLSLLGDNIEMEVFKKVLSEMGADILPEYVDRATGATFDVVRITTTVKPIALTDNQKEEIRNSVVSVINAGVVKNIEGWYKQEELSLQLNKTGFRKEKYGKKSKMTYIFQQAFGNLLEIKHQGTTVFLKFDDEFFKGSYGSPAKVNINKVTEITKPSPLSANNEHIVTDLYQLGFVERESWEKLSQLSGIPDITIKSINDYIIEEPKYLNGAGYPKFSDGTPVSAETGKFILLRTSLKNNDGCQIIGWFNRNTREKQKLTYTGIVWGIDEDFENSRKFSRNCQVGRMIFKDWEGCKDFFESLNGKIIPEPWAYKNKLDGDFKYPILKSYLQFELDRLFYEAEILNLPGKILYSPDNRMILFNTNLINKYGDDLFIVGKKVLLNGKICISDLEVAPSKSRLSKCGFSTTSTPNPPQFFKDINEIVFHCSWEIDDDMEKREHIIEERIERFPERYRDLRPDDLGQKLNNAINFATKIAQRNYKFIVPMYYPTRQRIQLLMPIYLDTTYSNHPDFALVLTPCQDAKLYVPETILGLDEVYQDARLIAKPEESWLNPNMIE